MNENVKRYVLTPILLVLISILLIISTGAWKYLKWIPFTKVMSSILYIIPIIEGSYDPVPSGLGEFNFKDMKKFVHENSDNAEYYFGYAFLSGNHKEFIEFTRKAEQIDPDNPIYPYFLGLEYSRNLTGIDHDDIADQPESTLLALNRAGELAPDNAAIDLAKLNVFIQEVDHETQDSYLQKRDGGHSSRQIHNIVLTDAARAVIKTAMTKSRYNAYSLKAASYSLKLLKDSGNDGFFTRVNFLMSYPLQRFVNESRGFRLFIKDIGPYDDFEKVEAKADTLLRLAQIGLLITEDPDRSMIQNGIGFVYIKHSIDLLGDLYLVNDMPSSERAIGLLHEISNNWRYMWGASRRSHSRMGYPHLWGFRTEQLVAIGIGSSVIAPLVFTLLAFIIGIVGSSVYGISGVEIKLGFSAFGSFLVIIFLSMFVLLGVLLTQMEGDPAGFVFSGALIAFGLVFFVASFIRRKSDKHYVATMISAFLVIIGLSGVIISLLDIRGLTSLPFFISVLLGLIGVGLIASVKTENKYRAFWAALTRFSAGALLIFTIVIVATWVMCGSPLSKFMTMKEQNLMLELVGPGEEMPRSLIGEYKSSAHYISNTGISSGDRETRLKRLEEMYGKDFE